MVKMMEDKSFREIFASPSRVKIFNLLSIAPKSISQLSKETGLTTTSVRFHLQKLLGQDMIKEIEKRGKVGRPKSTYIATGKRINMSFPPRDYFLLSDLLIKTLSTYDQKEIHKRLTNIGKDTGIEFAKNLKNAVTNEWTIDSIKKKLIDGMFKDLGVQPEIIKLTDRSIQYREYNCPFKELAVKYPDIVCDGLDNSFNLSLYKSLNPNFDLKKLKCMGKGDHYCEYVVSMSQNIRKRKKNYMKQN
jgi:predicted ArsR family transcriptional regulator